MEIHNSGWQLKDGSTIENQVEYDYDPAGRLSQVLGLASSSLASPGFTYGYQANSDGLISSVTGPAHTVTNTWEPARDILASKQNKVGTTVISQYDYAVNAIGQRTNLTQTGSAFASARSTAWGYDPLGQVTSADSSIPDYNRAYEYDAIGNRKKTADSLTLPASNNYTANTLNQYIAVQQGSVGVSPAHDDDGNATAYPLPTNPGANSTLTWDAENRLVSAAVNSATTTYLYDAYSRRIATKQGAVAKVVVYDAWNPIAEYGSVGVSPTLQKTYTWGLDLSGSMQGAGGVGGLLAVTDSTGTYFPTFDGNGNVSEYLNSSGAFVAHYEYDPFGRTTVATGTKAQDFSHRFSTKPLDATTGLYYYGYRFYDPVTGRWPSRDPIGEGWETGELNLYGFVSNDAVNWVDLLGLQKGRRGWKPPGKRHVPPKPSGHSGFHHYGNWGGPGWANGGWNYESDPQPEPGDPDYNAPWNERDACYEQHDRCISNCPDPDDWERCPGRSRQANAENGRRRSAAANAHSDCVEDCDHELADCLRDAGHGGAESFMFDTLIPWLIH